MNRAGSGFSNVTLFRQHGVKSGGKGLGLLVSGRRLRQLDGESVEKFRGNGRLTCPVFVLAPCFVWVRFLCRRRHRTAAGAAAAAAVVVVSVRKRR